MRRSYLVVTAAALLTCALLAPAWSAASGVLSTRCAFVRASVPYSHHGHHDRWGIYRKGATSCAAAKRALNAVMHLDAAVHNGTNNANSYFTYRGWTCDFGQMGAQSCWRPRHRPYTASALALDCTTPYGCPIRIPSANLP
jgi:hypothetical protein